MNEDNILNGHVTLHNTKSFFTSSLLFTIFTVILKTYKEVKNTLKGRAVVSKRRYEYIFYLHCHRNSINIHNILM